MGHENRKVQKTARLFNQSVKNQSSAGDQFRARGDCVNLFLIKVNMR